MAVNPQFINDDRGQDESVANQRVRAYVPDTPGVSSVVPTGTGTSGGGGSYGTLYMQGTGVPTSFASGAQTYTAAIIGGGFIVHNTGSTSTAATTDTAANILAYMVANSGGVQVGDFIQCSVMNTGSTGLLTINGAPPTGITFDGNAVNTIAAGVTKTLSFRCTSTSTPSFVIYM